jgi:hypothetical protein
MRLHEYLNLPAEHSISFEDGRKLHEDIALNGCGELSKEQSNRLQTYLENCLLYQTIEPRLVDNLKAICADLQSLK